MKSEAALPVQAIFDGSVIGVSKTLPVLNEIVRSVVAPTIVVNFFQSAFTSVSITPAIVFGLLSAVAAPFQVTATTSITRSSTAYAGANPSEAKAKTIAINTETLLRILSILNLPRTFFMSIYPKHLIPLQFRLAKPLGTIISPHHYGSCHGITEPTQRSNNCC